MAVQLLRHQTATVNSIFKYPDIDYVFFSGGFGCGKSFTIVSILTCLLHWFQGEYLTFGIGGAAIKHLKETVIKDFLGWLDKSKIPYKHNGQEGILLIGTLTFVYFSLDRPDTIFGHNLSGCLADEGGELTDKERFAESMTAIQERNRVDMPITPAIKRWLASNGWPIPMVKDGATGLMKPGRSPFTISTTTAQGYDGVWQFMQQLEEAKQPYIRIRAKTKDNFHNSQKQLERLYALYTEDEARVFLEGEYLNLQVGRVYAEFDDKRNIYTPFGVHPEERIYVGQDFNPGYNGAVAAVIRANKIYVVGEYRWSVVGDAPRQLRERFPTNPITMIPDASGKEILSGWQDEFNKWNVECYWYNINPQISERVLVLNKLYRTSNCFIFPGCKMLTNGMLLRGFDDNGKPEKGKGPKALDHHCDAMEYMVWHVTHTIGGFEEILSVLRHRATEYMEAA
jgi:hypothetical protein